MSKPRLKVFTVTRENYDRLLGAQVLLHLVNQKKPAPIFTLRLCRVHTIQKCQDSQAWPGGRIENACLLHAAELEMQIYPGHRSNRNTHEYIPVGTKLFVADLKPEAEV